MDNYTIIYWDPTDHWQRIPTEIRSKDGKGSIKDVQDSIAEMLADGTRDHMLYMVVRKDDWKGFFQTGFFHGKAAAL